MSGPVSYLDIRAKENHVTAELLEQGNNVFEEIPPPTKADGYLNTALWWVAAGYKIFPLYPPNEPAPESEPDKEDMAKTPNGRLLGKGNHVEDIATTDLDQIHRWWTRDKHSNVGLATQVSGILVIDIDPKNGGWPVFLQYCTEHNIDLSQVPRQLTARGDGGVHLFWRLPEDAPTYKHGVFRTGVDRPWQVPASRSQAPFLAPSRGSAPGTLIYREYEWMAGDPRHLPVAPVALLREGERGKLRKLVGKAIKNSGAERTADLADSDHLPRTDWGTIDSDKLDDLAVPAGSQNDEFWILACSLVGKKLSREAIVSILLKVAHNSPLSKPDKPWTRAHMVEFERRAREWVDKERTDEMRRALATLPNTTGPLTYADRIKMMES